MSDSKSAQTQEKRSRDEVLSRRKEQATDFRTRMMVPRADDTFEMFPWYTEMDRGLAILRQRIGRSIEFTEAQKTFAKVESARLAYIQGVISLFDDLGLELRGQAKRQAEALAEEKKKEKT